MFLTKEQFIHAMSINDKMLDKSPLLTDLSDWAAQEIGIGIIDYFCDATPDGRIRLVLVLWDTYAVRSKLHRGVNYDPDILKKISDKFMELAKKYDIHHEYHGAEKIVVAFDMVKDELRRIALGEAKKEILNLEADGLTEICVAFGTVHFVFDSEARIEENNVNGISEALKLKCGECLRRYDRYGVWENGAVCIFLSRELLDEGYKGDLSYYIKCRYF